MLAGAVAIVSGRSVDDLARLLAPFPGTLIGQHGLERRRADGRTVHWSAPPALARIRETLTEFAAQHDGVALEDTGATLALHYRQAPRLAAACRDIAQRASELVGGVFEAVDGKMVVELVPEGSGKGGAIAVLLTELPFAGRVPIFVGDDSVDEEGFAVIDGMGGISIHVGEGATSARYGVGSVGELRASAHARPRRMMAGEHACGSRVSRLSLSPPARYFRHMTAFDREIAMGRCTGMMVAGVMMLAFAGPALASTSLLGSGNANWYYACSGGRTMNLAIRHADGTMTRFALGPGESVRRAVQRGDLEAWRCGGAVRSQRSLSLYRDHAVKIPPRSLPLVAMVMLAAAALASAALARGGHRGGGRGGGSSGDLCVSAAFLDLNLSTIDIMINPSESQKVALDALQESRAKENAGQHGIAHLCRRCPGERPGQARCARDAA